MRWIESVVCWFDQKWHTASNSTDAAAYHLLLLRYVMRLEHDCASGIELTQPKARRLNRLYAAAMDAATSLLIAKRTLVRLAAIVARQWWC
ncbi:hypothetical protein F4W66_08155 [Escherichia coli]|nr:hypothetical protein F4W66_08155 [Escherichia coli]